MSSRTSMLSWAACSLGLSVLSGNLAWAAPLASSGLGTSRLVSRQSGGGSETDSGVNPQVWIPAVIVVVFILIVFATMWIRRSYGNPFKSLCGGSRTNTRTNGTPNRSGATTGSRPTGNGTTTTPAAPRPRRNRRTPSQMSTTSLPAYMKEPGEQELVIIRGEDDMEDDPMHMPSVEEQSIESHSANGHNGDEGDSPDTTGNAGMRMPHSAPIYSPVPLTGNDDEDAVLDSTRSSQGHLSRLSMMGSAEESRQHLLQSPMSSPESRRVSSRLDINRARNIGAQHAAHPSIDTLASTSENILPPGIVRDGRNGTIRLSMIGDLRGEAPSYFEAVAAGANTPEGLGTPSPEQAGRPSVSFSDAHHEPPISPAVLTPSPAEGNTSDSGAAPTRSASGRRSGFRTFFSSFGQGHARRPTGHSHTSSVSNNSQPSQHSDNPSRLSHIASRSTVSLTHGRGLSLARTITGGRDSPSMDNLQLQNRNSSINNLTSPSVLSVNSISAPLSHTVVRTGFRYPKNGPTPEQLKFLSSRETLGKFGVPYGPDAIAHASSIGLASPEVPPPGFETAVRGQSDLDQSDAGPSSASPHDDMITTTTTEVDETGEEETLQATTGSNAPAASSSSPASHRGDGREDSLHVEGLPAASTSQAQEYTPQASSPLAKAPTNAPQLQEDIPDNASFHTAEPSSTSSKISLGKRYPHLRDSNATVRPASALSHPRSASRASSAMSFETAAEDMDEDDMDGDQDETFTATGMSSDEDDASSIRTTTARTPPRSRTSLSTSNSPQTASQNQRVSVMPGTF